MSKLTPEYLRQLQSYEPGELHFEFIHACEYGYMEDVRYLLTSPELKYHADIHTMEDFGFRLACSNGHLPIVEYLISSPELTEHANVHIRHDYGFRYACEHERYDTTAYLFQVFEAEQYPKTATLLKNAYITAGENFRYTFMAHLLTIAASHTLVFEDTSYDITWAIQHGYDDLLYPMMISLKQHDYVKYLEWLPKIAQYCQEHHCSEIYHMLMNMPDDMSCHFAELPLHL